MTYPVSISQLAETGRWSLRIDPNQLSAASAAFGLEIPAKIGARMVSGEKEALCLGPDEWLLIAPEAEIEAVQSAFAGLYAEVPHALVPVSDRDVSLSLEGERVIELLEAGCPRNLSKVPVGEGRRTVFDGVTVVFVRVSDHKVRLDAWRSFVPHVTTLLNRVNQEMAIGL